MAVSCPCADVNPNSPMGDDARACANQFDSLSCCRSSDHEIDGNRGEARRTSVKEKRMMKRECGGEETGNRK